MPFPPQRREDRGPSEETQGTSRTVGWQVSASASPSLDAWASWLLVPAEVEASGAALPGF